MKIANCNKYCLRPVFIAATALRELNTVQNGAHIVTAKNGSHGGWTPTIIIAKRSDVKTASETIT